MIAVSKTHPAEAVREALDFGQTVFGENRVQELISKAPLLPAAARWHLIGHLQKNKIRKILPLVELIHGVDSLELARDIDRVAQELGPFPEDSAGGECLGREYEIWIWRRTQSGRRWKSCWDFRACSLKD